MLRAHLFVGLLASFCLSFYGVPGSYQVVSKIFRLTRTMVVDICEVSK
jgi:hypothetical protein